MNDELTPEPAPPPPPPPPPERYPFWSYSDLFLFLGLAVAALFGSVLVVRIGALLLHAGSTPRTAETLIAQLLLDGFVLGSLALILRLQYDRPFWRSLGWTSSGVPLLFLVIAGFGTAIAVGLASTLIKMPTTSNPMTEMMADRTSILFIAAFGVTLGPLAEELVFRGFLQPLLVRSLGAVAGILAAALPFGLLHFQEYGNSWAHVLLISMAGAAFGWMRHATGSTRASTLMHASYNALLFMGLFAQRKDLPHLW